MFLGIQSDIYYYYIPVSYFCFATSQNCIFAEVRLPTVIRKVKFTDFVKRATSPKCSWRNFVFIQILRYIHYFDWRNMENFRKILSLPERLEDSLLGGLCLPTKISPSLREKFSKVGSKWRLKSTSQRISYHNKPFYKFKPMGVSLDCKPQQIKICHNQCIYTTNARVKVHLHNPCTRWKYVFCRSGSFVDLLSSGKKLHLVLGYAVDPVLRCRLR